MSSNLSSVNAPAVFAKAPFGMAGAAVLFWGWQTGMLVLAVPLAIAIEAGALWRPRWSLDADGINRFADLSSLSLIAVAAWFLVTLEAPRAARTVIGTAQWLPLTLAPLALAQAWLARVPLDLSVLFVTIRARPDTGLRADFGFIYTIACVLAAATANVRDEMFYAGAAVFAAWALWNLRSRRYNRLIPFAMLMAASIMGYAGHQALNRFQGALTEWIGELIVRSANTNPFRTHTDIGQIGELKQSERVLLQVRLPPGEKVPLLLHRASYNVFSSPSWIARPVVFDALAGDVASGWSLREGGAGADADAQARRARSVEVLEYARNGKTIASLPMGTAHIDGLPPSELRRSRLGSTNIETAGGFLRYRAWRGPDALVESPPGEIELRVPPREAEAITAIAGELGLAGIDPLEAKRRIETFFAQNFRYTTWLEASSPFAPTPLSAFLTRTRAGHCEYFASATTLLLREAGIPARYATGFSVQEKSGADYLVRERHAHAWARAWIGEQWVDIDTTPPQWFGIEGGNAGLWEAVSDAWAWVKFAWGRYQTGEEDAVPRPVLIGLLVILFGWLAWRIFRQPAKRAMEGASKPGATVAVNGADSEFYRIEKFLAGLQLGRGPAEPLREWLARIGRSESLVRGAEDLRAIVALHYRLRFDPQPMEAAAREELRLSVERWLAAF